MGPSLDLSVNVEDKREREGGAVAEVAGISASSKPEWQFNFNIIKKGPENLRPFFSSFFG